MVKYITIQPVLLIIFFDFLKIAFYINLFSIIVACILKEIKYEKMLYEYQIRYIT